MKRFITPALSLLLTAPAWSIPTPPPVQISDTTLVREKTVRTDKGVNTVVRAHMATGEVNEMWLNVDCRANKQYAMLFTTLYRTKGDVLRIYPGNSISRYASAMPFEPDADSLLITQPDLDVCRLAIPESHWEGISSPDEQGDRYFIDTRNSEKQGERLHFRLATDYARLYRDDKYAAPYAMKIQDIVFDCAKKTGSITSQVFIDEQGLVTDDTPAVALPDLSAENAVLSAKLCDVKNIQRYEGTGPLTAREKKLAENQLTLPNFPLNPPDPLNRSPLSKESAAIVATILADKQQHPAFSRLGYTLRWSDSESDYSTMRIDRQPDGTTLTLDAMTLGGVTFYQQHLRLFNFVDLKRWDAMSTKPAISQTLKNDVTAPLVAGKTYSWFNTWDDGKSTSEQCKVEEEWQNAASLNPAFSGRYVEVICQDDRGDGKAMSSDYAWLEDLRVFIRIGYHEAGTKKRMTLTDITITR